MASCSTSAESGPNYTPTEVYEQGYVHGGMGVLSPEEAGYMQHLAWPQTYTDMVGTFGLANRSTATADIYRVEGSDAEVWVYYDGVTATSFEIK